MIYAMFGMVLLTFLIAVVVVVVRVKSVLRGRVSISYFQVMNGRDIPEFITRSARCFNNLFEVPVLFYAVSTLFVCLNLHSSVALVLAWCFVGFRVAHAIVFLTYNKVLHRMLLFLGSFISVLAMWVVLLLSLV